jgi:hypothetical protein
MGAIDPTTLGGATIILFEWYNTSGYGSPGTLILTLNGNTGTGTYNANVNGVNLGNSGAGVYNGSSATSYTWGGSITNPFGTTVGAVLACTIS